MMKDSGNEPELAGLEIDLKGLCYAYSFLHVEEDLSAVPIEPSESIAALKSIIAELSLNDMRLIAALNRVSYDIIKRKSPKNYRTFAEISDDPEVETDLSLMRALWSLPDKQLDIYYLYHKKISSFIKNLVSFQKYWFLPLAEKLKSLPISNATHCVSRNNLYNGATLTQLLSGLPYGCSILITGDAHAVQLKHTDAGWYFCNSSHEYDVEYNADHNAAIGNVIFDALSRDASITQPLEVSVFFAGRLLL